MSAEDASRRILIVEDDPSISAGLAMNLRFEGHTVEVRADGERGLERALEWAPDLVVLDLMLPGMNGYEVCRALRKEGNDTAVLILSAKGTEEDKVLGLDLGADDYVTKPFGIRELIARVNALFRRRGDSNPCVRVGEAELDVKARRLTRDGEAVAMTAREIALLEHFVNRPGRVMSRGELLEAVWGEGYEGSARTVDNFVRRLRVKVEADPENPQHLLTVVGMGYRYEPKG